MDELIEGYRRFRVGTWRDERARFEQLSRLGQKPRALVIACSDSRTDPQMVFNAAPGELFVIPGWRYKLLVRMMKMLPTALIRWATARSVRRARKPVTRT